MKSSEFFYNPSQPRILDESGGESSGIQNAPSQETFADAGLEAMTEIYNTALILLKGRKVDESRKRGLLSVRAASMLVCPISFIFLYSIYFENLVGNVD